MYAAALALLIVQLREQAPMPDVLLSVRRLTTLARVGRVSITIDQLDAPPNDAMAGAVQGLRDAMRDHGLASIEVATTVTDTEFLKLAGLLSGSASLAETGIVAAADALSIWNVRLRSNAEEVPASGSAPSVVTPSNDSASTSLGVSKTSAPSGHATASTSASADQDTAVRQAVQRGDGAGVCRALTAITERGAFERAATPVALQLATEWLVEDQAAFTEVFEVLERAGERGARAVFEQLVAASAIGERRVLYDTAAGLSATIEVARQYLADPVWYVVRNAAGLLGESRNPEAVPDLARLLRHTDERVRVAAVVALGQIGGTVALGRLESALLDPSPEVRSRALALVFASPETETIPTPVPMVHDDETAVEFQLETIAALAHVRTPRARQRLETLCAENGAGYDSLQIRLAAMNALAAGHRPEADVTLRRLLDDPASSIRERAASLLA